MKFTISQKTLSAQSNHALIVAVPSEGELPSSTQAINDNNSGLIETLREQKDFTGKTGETMVLPNVGEHRVILLGIGKQPMKANDFVKATQAAAKALKGSAADQGAIDLADITVKERDSAWLHVQLAQQFQDALYSFTECKSQKEEKQDEPQPSISQLTVVGESELQIALEQGQAIAQGMAVAKRLGDLPPNIATPSYLAEEAEKLAASSDKVSATILDEDKMEELGMGSFLSVSKGSIEPGKLICIEYKGGKAGDAPHVLVGKGITFDTGGISLKPGAGMDEMKYDMCGAASVLGTMSSMIALDLSINFVAIVAAAENMPAGHASKPGDIVTAMNGTTIEILNTDAEGRLVLCDALSYAIDTYKPASIVDIATLTGACMMALGGVNSGLFSQDEDMVTELQNAAANSHDAVWRLPLQEEYQELLDSNFADLANIGGRLAGATTAACFLSRFTEGQKWAHVDIAGTAWTSGGKNKGASGRPVPLLVTYLANKLK